MNFLKFSRLFPAADWLALWFLQCIYTETGNKTSVVVANNPESVMDRRFSQLVKHTQGSVERIHCHSLIDTDVKSASTKYSLMSMRITLPRLQLVKSLLPNSNIVSCSCDHNGGIIASEEGIKVTIPEGAIKGGDLVTFHMATDLFGPFVLPISSKCQSELASPYYQIGVSESYHFHKPVQVELEHFAVVTACDPSHYQLLCCEDDDESYTMRPVDYELSFRVQGDISLCTFQTQHFCVYCLVHNHTEPIINKIGTYFLKPNNFQNLDQFTVEVWFSFPFSYCERRNKELYTQRGLVLHSRHIFEASSDKGSTNYFTLSYEQNINGWLVDHSGSKDQIIKTKKVNFYNYYTEEEKLKQHEELSLFPPRFIVNIRNTKHRYATNLDLNVIITLCNNIKERKLLDTTTMKLLVPLPATAIEDSTRKSKESSTSVSHHECEKK